ncbi:MAG: diguanylate cyclase domain-containing protein [Thermodesulfobacteriota bacterium]
MNKKIEEIIEIESYQSIGLFLEDIKNSITDSAECRLFGQQRYIKSKFVVQNNEIYFVFSPFEENFSISNHDKLTGLPSRELFFDRSTQIIYGCQRNNSKMAVIFLDLDGFKPVNDTYGHKAGDIVLQVLSKRLEETLRKTDSVARFGGDEFILALSGLKEGIHASLGAKRILKIIEKPIDIGEKEVSVSASIGISIFPDDGNDIKDLMKKADAAMYKAKNSKRGYSFYNMEKFLGG